MKMVDETKLKIVDENSEDPFDLAKLRLNQDFLEITQVKKLITTIPLRKPGQQDFIRVHPSPSYRELVAILELKEDRESYVVNLETVPELKTECFAATLFTAITRSGVLFLWPVRVPAVSGKGNDWHLSAATAAEQAMKSWVRIRANMSLQAYEIFLAEDSIPDPEWPAHSFQQLINISLRDRLVHRSDHPVLRRLRGRHV
jgi:hypothetical protein